MKRAGSTVQYQITSEIVESHGVGKRLGFVNPNNFKEVFYENSGYNGFRIVKAHAFIEQAKELIDNREAKAIYIFRDIRDVAVSMQKKSYKSYWRYLLSGDIDTILKQYRSWNSVNSIMVSKYEMMINDLAGEALKIADYLGISIEKANAQCIAEKYSLDHQREMIQKFDYEDEGFSIGENNTLKVNPHSLLHRNHIRSGAPKQWEKELSPLQIGLIELLTFEWLTDRGYEISQPWVNSKISRSVEVILRSIWQFRRLIRELR